LLKKYTKNISPGLLRFLVRALVLVIVWKLSYHLFLKPHRFPDKALTELTADQTVRFVGLFYPPNTISWHGSIPKNDFDLFSAIIVINGRKVVGIADPCNALELYVLYIGFLICVPTTIKRFILFALGGIAVIFVLNILRCSGMIWVNIHHNQVFDFAHHYLFKLIVYAAIFGGWVWYSKHLTRHEQ
jgi:exosortase/archaeosortase family protein